MYSTYDLYTIYVEQTVVQYALIQYFVVMLWILLGNVVPTCLFIEVSMRCTTYILGF